MDAFKNFRFVNTDRCIKSVQNQDLKMFQKSGNDCFED
jgi:hypothetical protein